MKRSLQPQVRNLASLNIAQFTRWTLALFLVGGGLIFAPNSIFAATDHPPTVSWVPDQRLTVASGTFTPQYFRIKDYDNDQFTITWQSSDTTFFPHSILYLKIMPCSGSGCPADGGYQITFPNSPPTGISGETTITIIVTETAHQTVKAETSFTLQVDTTGGYPAVMGALPNQDVQISSTTGSATYKTMFVIGDVSDMDPTKEDVDQIDTICNHMTCPGTMCDFVATSSNPAVIGNSSDGAITFQLIVPSGGFTFGEGPRSYLLTATTNSNSATGFATITVTLTDPDCHKTYKSFVLQAVAATNGPPSITRGPAQSTTYVVYPVPTPNPTPTPYQYSVSDTGTTLTPKKELFVTASSSNTKLVPNENLVVTQPDINGIGQVKITPVLPLPTPAPGVPQSSTITLSVMDDKYTQSAFPFDPRQNTFLFVATPAASVNAPATSFSRPSGIYLLDPDRPGDHRSLDPFLTGEMRRLSWHDVETGPPISGDQYNWAPLDDIMNNLLTTNQTLSLNLVDEPCYIAQLGYATQTWCDTKASVTQQLCEDQGDSCTNGVLRALPWDSYLKQRRDHFIQQLAVQIATYSNASKLQIINPNLAGGDTGIRELDDQPFSSTTQPGYSRLALLQTIQDLLETVQDNFPGKLVQFGFFKALDNLGPSSCTGSGCYPDELWQWLYKDASTPGSLNKDANGNPLMALADEFNGTFRPRVAFFQEDLAAARAPGASAGPNYLTPALSTAYGFTPDASFIPSFAFYSSPTNAQYNNGITFQANTPWSSPFIGGQSFDKVTKTLDGSPNDGLEAAFNAYLSQYLELYPQDADSALPYPPGSLPPTLDAVLWQGELQSWKDYFDSLISAAPIEGPAGLTIKYQDSTHFIVTCKAVYGATSYKLQSQLLTTGPGVWIDAAACDPTSPAGCTVQVNDATKPYAVRIQAVNGTKVSAWSNAAIFVSEAANDGYVIKQGSTLSSVNTSTQPAILAGEGSGMPLPHWKGILSFNTGALYGVTTTVLGARFRLHQETAGTNITPSHSCMVDMKLGTFGNLALEGTDYTAMETTTDVFNVLNVGANNWFEWSLTQATAMANIGIGNTSSTDHTQFRIYFSSGTMSNKNEGWDSGESTASLPQLIVQYQ